MRVRRIVPPAATGLVRRTVHCGRCRPDHGGERGDLLVGRLAAYDTQVGMLVHSGMLPCFFGGRLCRLLRSMRSDRITYDLVCDGGMTESTYPRSAAMYGLTSVSS